MRMGWLVVVMACKKEAAKTEDRPPIPYEDRKPTFDDSLELLSPGAKPLAVRRTFGRGRTITNVATVSVDRFDIKDLGDAKTHVRTFDVELRGTEVSIVLDSCQAMGRGAYPSCDLSFKGKRWKLELNPHGTIKAFTELPGERSGIGAISRIEIEQAIVALFPPIPTVAIGVGAKWRSRIKGSTSGGGDQSLDATYELTAIKDGVLMVAVTTDVVRHTPLWVSDELVQLDEDRGFQRGAIAIPTDGTSTARLQLVERFEQKHSDHTKDHQGRIEAKTDGTELPMIPATCEQAAKCCQTKTFGESMKATCANAIASKDPASCAIAFAAVQRTMLMMGGITDGCL